MTAVDCYVGLIPMQQVFESRPCARLGC